MYIYKIDIGNFRNFKSFSWKPNPKMNVLFGANGCGKSNLAAAIALTFASISYDSYFEESDYYLGDTTLHIRIQIWLDDINVLATSYSEYLQHINKDDNFVADDTPNHSKPVLIYQLESGEDRRMEWSFYQQTQQPLCSLSARKAVNFTYIDADRQPLKEVGLQTRSTFYKMAHDSIGGEIERISQEIIQEANKKLAESGIISTYLDTLNSLGKIALIEKYNILLKNPESTWNYSGYELGTSIGDAQLHFSKQSKGIRSLFLLMLMKEQLKGAGIVFIEELEQNLEPKYQRYIADEYKRLSVGQIFITSHSPDIISHFDYQTISTVSSVTSTTLLSGLDDQILKDIQRLNKKEFLSSLMADTILLVEGESEFEAFPIYSYIHDLALSKYDVELLRVGGKAKFKPYCQALKHFGKTVYVLIDNDADVKRYLNEISGIAAAVFVAQDSYEDLILPFANKYISHLHELVDFSVIKDKLLSIESYNVVKYEKPDAKKVEIHNFIKENRIDITGLNSYEDLLPQKRLLKYVLHDSFANPYFSRIIAAWITGDDQVPGFFKALIKHISADGEKLNVLNGYTNVFALNGD